MFGCEGRIKNRQYNFPKTVPYRHGEQKKIHKKNYAQISYKLYLCNIFNDELKIKSRIKSNKWIVKI